MCATSRKIELSVKPIIFLLQMYFEGIRRGSEKVPIHGWESCDYDIVVSKALHYVVSYAYLVFPQPPKCLHQAM